MEIHCCYKLYTYSTLQLYQESKFLIKNLRNVSVMRSIVFLAISEVYDLVGQPSCSVCGRRAKYLHLSQTPASR